MNARLALIAVLLLAPSSPASAYIPPKPLPEVGWAGPGHLCEEEFTLKVRADEYVREDVQLEPSYPPSNTIKSAAGWFTVSTLIMKPDEPERRYLRRRDRLGALYEYPEDALQKRFVFFPSAADRPAVQIAFYKVEVRQQSDDWRLAPQRSYDPSHYDDVLRRIVFAKSNPGDCLNP